MRQCQEYIKAGDIFQVVPSQRFAIETKPIRSTSTACLRVVNPSPFLFYLPYGDFSLIGSSPEILVRVEDGVVTIRPLAGTRRRGVDEAEDQALADELLADPKERAEHIMLVDLGRNDVGRVADYQTVQLTDVMKVERYSPRDAYHLERDRQAAARARRLLTPCGPVCPPAPSRAPQGPRHADHRRGRTAEARAVRRRRRLHRLHRQHGYCIALRTLVLQGTTAYIQAGGGVVYDSDPGAEYEETINKARGLLESDRDRRVAAPTARTRIRHRVLS